MTDFVTLFYCLVFLDPHEFSATYLKFLEAQIYLFINNKLTLNVTSSFALLIVTKLSLEVSLIMNLGKNIITIQSQLYVGKKKIKFIMATTSSFTSRYRNRLHNKAAQDAIITRKVENYTAFARQHICKWVNKRGRLLARVHKAVNSTVVLSAVASPNEDRLIALEAQIKLFKHIMRSNGESSRQSDCKICLKILYFCTPFPLHIPMLIKKGSIWPVFALLF